MYTIKLLLTALVTADIGPIPITLGSTPTWAQDTIRANGGEHCNIFSTLFDTNITAAAPSLIPNNHANS